MVGLQEVHPHYYYDPYPLLQDSRLRLAWFHLFHYHSLRTTTVHLRVQVLPPLVQLVPKSEYTQQLPESLHPSFDRPMLAWTSPVPPG